MSKTTIEIHFHMYNWHRLLVDKTDGYQINNAISNADKVKV